jgi:hypothetical protein
MSRAEGKGQRAGGQADHSANFLIKVTQSLYEFAILQKNSIGAWTRFHSLSLGGRIITGVPHV